MQLLPPAIRVYTAINPLLNDRCAPQPMARPPS